ncbi:MAG TPA: inorganic phosphate transporter [Candidatus Angelobacter sp.]|nr:inorganic phosphate transporter [Candidatus Angelobacter sp.]
MHTSLVLVLLTVFLALSFDFINGFHDAANSIATVVSTRVLSPRVAVLWAATFNFIAAFGLGTAVAKTVGKGMVHLEYVTQYVVLAGLIGAIIWNLITWFLGLPTSSSHALFGGYAGAAIARAGFKAIIPAGWKNTLAFIVISPIMGFILALALMVLVSWLFRGSAPRKVDKLFRGLQLLSSAGVSFAHGANDAQKTMGIIVSALYAGGYLTAQQAGTNWGRFHLPIILAAYFAISLGTYFGGWRIVHTMGSKITKLKPVGGFCAESAAALTLVMTALWGIPVSTTHTITGSIIGVGSTHRISAVRWGVARRIVWAWIITIPAGATMAAGCWFLIRLFIPNA